MISDERFKRIVQHVESESFSSETRLHILACLDDIVENRRTIKILKLKLRELQKEEGSWVYD